MPQRRKVTEDMIARMVALRNEGMSTREIGSELGLGFGTVAGYLREYGPDSGARKQTIGGQRIKPSTAGGPPPEQPIDQVVDATDIDGTLDILKLDGFMTPEELAAAAGLDPKLWLPTHFKPNVWQGFYKVKGKDGRASHKKVNLFQSKAAFKRIMETAQTEAISRWAQDNVAPLPSRKRKAPRAKDGVGQMLSWGIWDAHLGQYTWGPEVGTDSDIGQATRRVFNSIDDMVEELGPYNIGRVLMPMGNDFMHFDSVRMTTTHGDHLLDTDSRYAKIYLACLRCLTYMVFRALEFCDDVELLYIPGNHDHVSSFGLIVALAQRFANDPRVHFDLSPNPKKYRTHGGTLLGFHHGHKTKASQYATIMPTDPGAREVWSDTTWREMQIGHVHQRHEWQYTAATSTNGVLVRVNPALCNVDYYHHSLGLTGEPLKSVEAWRYDDLGYRGSHVAWARDGGSDAWREFLADDGSLSYDPPEPRDIFVE